MALPLSTNDAICCIRRQIADLRANRAVTPFRTGTAWPLAADIPAGTSIIWWNTTTTTARTYINVAGALHYTDFTT